MPASSTMEKTMPKTVHPENPQNPEDLSLKFLGIYLEAARKLLDIPMRNGALSEWIPQVVRAWMGMPTRP